jgi:hypothetical protein
MPFEHLNREQRRQMAAYAREQAAKRPAALTEIPRSRWPAHCLTDPQAPVKAFESRKYLAQLYDAGAHEGRTTMRLSVCRVTLKDDGRWEEDLQWAELMQVKRECGFGDWYAVEVYPRDSDIVNVANMRHLWLLSTPLTIGWFKLDGGCRAE